MPRDVIAEWKRALRRGPKTRRLAIVPAPSVAPSPIECSPGGEHVGSVDWRATRRLVLPAIIADDAEFAHVIRLSQRHNKALQSRFGVGWPEAVLMLLGESHRRGASIGRMAQGMFVRLRSDEGGARAAAG